MLLRHDVGTGRSDNLIPMHLRIVVETFMLATSYPSSKWFEFVWQIFLVEKGKDFNKIHLMHARKGNFFHDERKLSLWPVPMSSCRRSLSPDLNTRGLSPRPVEAWCVAHAQWRVTTQDLPNLYFSFSSLSFAPVRVLIASSWVSTYQGHKIVDSSLSECPLKSKTKWETVSEYIRLCNHQLILFIMSGHVVQNYQFLRSILAL